MLLLHLVVEAVCPEVFLRFAGSNTAQKQKGHEVWYRHQSVHAVGNIPDDIQIDDAAKEQEYDIQNTIELVDVASLDIVYCALSVVAPAEDGAEGKREDTEVRIPKVSSGAPT